MRPALQYRAFPVLNWAFAQHLIGLVQTEDRHVNIFDGWEQQAGNSAVSIDTGLPFMQFRRRTE